MQKVLIIGAGKGGTALLQILMKTKLIRIIAVVDQDPEAQERKKPGNMELQPHQIGNPT